MRNQIFLYEATESSFTSNGLGALPDYIKATVTENRNGSYELIMTYPLTGINYQNIALRRFILAKPNPTDNPQPFRIVQITEPTNGEVTILARHISYDLSGIPMNPFVALSLSDAVIEMNRQQIVNHPFVFSTDKVVTGVMQFDVPTSYRSLLGGIKGSILDTYGGDYHFDKYSVQLLSNRGTRTQDNPFDVTYKRNLSDFKNIKSSESTVSGVIGYWKPNMESETTEQDVDSDTVVMTAPLYSSITDIGSNETPFIEIVDFSSDFETKPTLTELTNHAEAYLQSNEHVVFGKNITFEFADYPEMLNSIGMCDIVRITFSKYNVVALAKVIKTTFNVGEDRFEKLEVGNARTNLSQRIISTSQELSASKQSLIDESREIRKELEETASMLREAIGDNQGNVSEITHAIDTIEATIASLRNSLSLTMTDQELMLQFIQEVNDRVDSNYTEQSERTSIIEKYVKFVDGALVIAIAGGAIKLKLFNDTIAFYDGADDASDMSNAFARFTNRELQVEAVICGKYLTIGKHWQILERYNNHWTLWRL